MGITVIGQTLDRYRIESKLGEGGMGVVYKARDTHLDRTVAIKVLPHDKVADAERKQRFVHEARAASALNHPNIVTVHDIRSDSGVDFIVMEYAGGRTLDQAIAERRLAITECLRYAVQIADALACAHEAGIIHRDLKPSNVMVTEEGRVKVLDFGLAKLLETPHSPTDSRTHTVALTEAGTVVGTAAYMSPEQAEGRKVDARSDIFSFGAVLYEMVTGRRPFDGNSELSVLSKILNEEPAPPSAIVPSLSPDIERTIMRCLRKDPARRYQTMADLKVALEDLVADSDSGQLRKAPVRHTSLSRRGAWLAVVLVVLAAGYFAWQRLRPSEREVVQLHAVPLTAFQGIVGQPTFSPEGDRVAFMWTGANQDNADIYVQQIGAGAPLRLTTDPAEDYSPAWSPDGRAIAFLRQQADHPTRHELRLIAPLGGPERKVAEIEPRGFLRRVTLAWCPDSTCVVLTDSRDRTKPDALFVVSIDTGEKRQLTTPQSPLLADTDPAVSPNGRWLAFRRDAAPFSGQLQLLQLDAGLTAVGEPRSLTATLLDAYAPDWISDSEIIFGGRGGLWRLATIEGSTPERLPFVGEDGLSPVVSRLRSGQLARLVYVRSFADLNIWRVDTSAAGAPATSPPRVTIASTRRDSIPQLSPDGRRVAFISDRSGESEVWVADVSGANPIQLTSMGANPGFPRWSPDGTMIAFHSNPAGQGDIFVVPAEGGKARSVVSGPQSEAFASFSHDGRWIYYSSSPGATASLWKAPLSGGPAVKVATTEALLAVESSDGAYLYYVDSRNTTRSGPLWRLPLHGGEPVKLADGISPAAFDLVDGGAYYLEQQPEGARLQYFEFAKGRSTTIATGLGNVGFGLSASRDGRTILYSRVDSSVNDLMLVENFR